jgi:hypothetical protein
VQKGIPTKRCVLSELIPTNFHSGILAKQMGRERLQGCA